MVGAYHALIFTVFSKQTDSLVCFVESEDVDFALLRVMGPVAVLCVDCAMTILSLPLLTCTTWVLLGTIDIVVINFLMKEMRGREVPLGVPEICTHKFRKSPTKLAKQWKNNADKIFMKIENIRDIISKIIFFPKEYFPFDSFALTTTWRTTMMISWFWRWIEDHK